jgi:hypothetical protein
LFVTEEARSGVYFAKRAFTKTRILVFFWWKMCDFGESYQKNDEPQRTTCGAGECDAWLPDPPLSRQPHNLTNEWEIEVDPTRTRTLKSE